MKKKVILMAMLALLGTPFFVRSGEVEDIKKDIETYKKEVKRLERQIKINLAMMEETENKEVLKEVGRKIQDDSALLERAKEDIRALESRLKELGMGSS